MTQLLKRLLADETGASTAEYAIVLAAVGTAAAAAMLIFNPGTATGGLSGMFTTLATKMSGWVN